MEMKELEILKFGKTLQVIYVTNNLFVNINSLMLKKPPFAELLEIILTWQLSNILLFKTQRLTDIMLVRSSMFQIEKAFYYDCVVTT